MSIMRHYIAFWNDGHDYGETEFLSTHRANSKANVEDAKAEMMRKFGYKRSRNMNIISTQLYHSA